MKVTISDVARLAGVSTATVSHTLNSTRYVSGETKEKVYRAYRGAGLHAGRLGQKLRTGKKKPLDLSFRIFPISFSQQ